MLSLDLLRVLGGDPGAAGAFLSACSSRLAAAAAALQQAQHAKQGSRVGRAMHAELLGRVCGAARQVLAGVEAALRATGAALAGPRGGSSGLPEEAQAGARDLALSMTRVFVAGRQARCTGCAGRSWLVPARKHASGEPPG